ncbi:MAG: helix-turn-helix domain-containing protein [Clostridiales bacterium]|nr:helix-turn-helix domain-containing protein [Clostridiales bacterium]
METHQIIKALREQQKISQEELAAKVGYKDRSSIAKVEAGKVDLSQTKIAAFAAALNVTPAQLMGIDNKHPTAHTSAIPPGFEPPPKMVKVPLVGSIACGEPILAEENIEGYVDAPESIHCDFSLACKGDSMIDAGIMDGDVVYIRAQPTVDNGQIAAVRIGEEATLKRVYIDGGQLTLMPANAKYPPKTYSGDALTDIQIEGKAVGYTHMF